MNFLLFLACSVFAFVFHFFYTRSIGKDIFFADFPAGKMDLYGVGSTLFLESISFMFLGIVFYMLFSNFETKKQHEESIKQVSLKDVQSFVVNFFKKYLYYIGFFLFYFSIYIILSQFGVSFGYFVFIISVIIFCLFFAASSFYIFRDFIKVNTILFSIIYIGNYILSFAQNQVTFIEIDFINSFLILVFFILTIYSDNFLLKKSHSDTPLTIYFFVYLFLFISFYSYLFFGSVHLTFAILGFLSSSFCYYLVPKIELFKNSVIPLRYTSLFFSYVSIIFSLLYLYMHGVHIFVLGLLILSGVFNFQVHRKYTNFVSLSFSFICFLVTSFLIFYRFIDPKIYENTAILFYSFFFAVVAILVPLFYKSKEIFEHYFFHTFSYIFNITGVIYFFYFNGFDILTFGVILLIESMFVFFSYYKINSLRIK